MEFLTEMSNICGTTTCPYIVGGDFNILRHCGEKNKKMATSQYVDRFNDIINTMCLREIFIEGGIYTWYNNQKHPTLEKLDRLVMSTDWKDLFPLVTVRKLVRDLSDHNSILLSTNSNRPQSPKPQELRFEMS